MSGKQLAAQDNNQKISEQISCCQSAARYDSAGIGSLAFILSLTHVHNNSKNTRHPI